MGFDRLDSESPFLWFVAQEFHNRGTKLRRRLSSKNYAYQLVQKLGLRVADKWHELKDIEALKTVHLGERAVLKYGRGWSARGVMLLERLDEDLFLDYMSLKCWSLAEIIIEQRKVAAWYNHKDPFWLIEEFLAATINVGAVPFDYKFYVFGKRIGLIIQIDRNTTPPKIVLFDGNFKPLWQEEDYIISQSVQRGTHLIPRHAALLLWWALRLAQETDAPFVSIDLYDTLLGPVFGEFTFSPGATHKRMISFSHRLIDYFDILFADAVDVVGQSLGKKAIVGVNYDLLNEKAKVIVRESDSSDLYGLSRHSLQEIVSLAVIQQSIYSVYGGNAYNGGFRGAFRFSEYYSEIASNTTLDLERHIAGHFSSVWQMIAQRMKAVHAKPVC